MATSEANDNGTGAVTIRQPGSAQYVRATTPHNSSVSQRPRAVAVVTNAETAAAAVEYAAAAGLRIAPQATGHGVTGDLGDDTLLVDTAGGNDVVVIPETRTARAGAGALWQAVNAAAQPHGLLAASGSAPDVGIAGYTFGGGVGWLTPAFGLAANALQSVTYVDGAGTVRVASDDAANDLDREALWAFRGGGGVGLAVELVFDLFPVTDLWAGYLLWPAEQLVPVVEAWAAGIESRTDVATSLSILHTPPGPPFPASLQNRPVVHLAAAAPLGAGSAERLRAALAGAGPPVVDTWGAADATTLAGIHLDPPAGTPALGMGRWVGPEAPRHAARILAAAAASEALSMVELRNVGPPRNARPGALTSPPGPFLLHAVGAVPNPARRAVVPPGLEQMRSLIADIDVGRGAVSFAEGQRGDPDVLVPVDRARLARLRAAIDPTGVFHSSRVRASGG
jgi:FAD/FMN-containing dehydrogenase